MNWMSAVTIGVLFLATTGCEESSDTSPPTSQPLEEGASSVLGKAKESAEENGRGPRGAIAGPR